MTQIGERRLQIGTSDWSLKGIGHTGGICEHCDRTLKHVYTVHNDVTGKTMTVGRTCCKKVTGWTLALKEAQSLLWFEAKMIERTANWAHFAAAFPDVAETIDADEGLSWLKREIYDCSEGVRACMAANFRYDHR